MSESKTIIIPLNKSFTIELFPLKTKYIQFLFLYPYINTMAHWQLLTFNQSLEY